jgi:hypothetical protein
MEANLSRTCASVMVSEEGVAGLSCDTVLGSHRFDLDRYMIWVDEGFDGDDQIGLRVSNSGRRCCFDRLASRYDR